MAVLERSELEASPLADLHAIADQLGLEGFRRLRKADLISTILGEEPAAGESAGEGDDEAPSPRARKRRSPRLRRGRAADSEEEDSAEEAEPVAEADTDAEEEDGEASSERASSRRGRSRGGRESSGSRTGRETSGSRSTRSEGGSRRSSGSGSSSSERDEQDAGGRTAEGVVEVLGNGSAFLRVDPPEPSDDDVYISAAQVRRCELVSGDRVSGPVRTPRRSERYPSLVRIDMINGTSADSVSDGARYEDLPVAWPTERLVFGSKDTTLEAIEWLTPLGKGSRATIVGGRGSGKSETLRSLFDALRETEGLELSVVLAGARPEEISEWQAGPASPAAALSFAASADSQAQAIERALDAAKRVASRGADALVLIDGLDGIPASAARRALACARNLREAGSLTVIATAAEPLGGETTVVALASTGGQPALDLIASATLHPELLVGDDGAEAIAKARAAAVESAG
jgi:transcription termination factor Rho